MEIQDSLELELARFLECRERPAKFILWAEDFATHVRRWAGEARCGDMLPCYDGTERMRLCERCAKSLGLRCWIAVMGHWSWGGLDYKDLARV